MSRELARSRRSRGEKPSRKTPFNKNYPDSDTLSVSTKEELGDDALAAEEGDSVLNEQELEETLEGNDEEEEGGDDDFEDEDEEEEEAEEEEEEKDTESNVSPPVNFRSKRDRRERNASKRKVSYIESDQDEEEQEEDELDEDEQLGDEEENFTDLKDLYSQPMPSGATDSSRMTKRQRALQGVLEEGEEDDMLELPPETSGRKKLTEEEMALRRVENARRRKNQSEKKLEEEKMETINRLLKRQSNTDKPRRGRTPMVTSDHSGTPKKTIKKSRVSMHQPFQCIRWINNQEGSRAIIPDSLYPFYQK
ncbi:Ino80 complex subunit Ies2 [Schizosaccharomyces cryophilus OY26]|uniref:Ino80 complex subunit Ies2 n=1 Tax=Schizosaccharomyces cryophilus (strain OY26 / ATCC MYA-4695 / CBS 11777 / NBRC 106824 / NRRL Y48691) TaxID=653667 RepID=S9X490_SCHCR|nr:Ino80 complex subunit Ies2 [Schizosaccharomyces cryophilus OY26]EPY51872.1 Ino80 complex subunit Ies2 [Schizosaccharomyces cryophilus OY26]